ncbi:MAG: hypothetical protein ACO3EF_00170 [Vulcanococcus sp.]
MRDLMDDVDQYSINRDVWERARAALAQPDPALSQRPECFEFALDFLGSPENDQLLEYVERLEARAALAQPGPEVMGPTDQELADAFAEGCRDGSKAGEPPFLGGARAVLARYGNHPAIPDSSTCKQSLPVAPAPPAAEGEVAEGPTDEELLATLDKATADFPPRHPEAESLNSVEYPLALELRKARAVLARYGHQPAPPAESEVGEAALVRRMCEIILGNTFGNKELDSLALLVGHHPDVLNAPDPAPDPTDEQLLATVDAVTVTLPPLPMDHADAHGRIDYDIAWRIAMARAVLARWGGQAAPVPVSERLPGDQLCWWFEADEDCGYGSNWTLLRIRGSATGYTHWLPATALPLPAGEVQP